MNEPDDLKPTDRKRKNISPGKGHTIKRYRLGVNTEDDATETASSDSGSDDESDPGAPNQVPSSAHFESDAMSFPLDVTEITLQEKLSALREGLEMAKIKKGQLCEQRWALEQERASVQKEKNAFCSLKRSEVHGK